MNFFRIFFFVTMLLSCAQTDEVGLGIQSSAKEEYPPFSKQKQSKCKERWSRVKRFISFIAFRSYSSLRFRETFKDPFTLGLFFDRREIEVGLKLHLLREKSSLLKSGSDNKG